MFPPVALRSLNLSQNMQITNSGLKHLSRLRNLTLLNISHSQVPPARLALNINKKLDGIASFRGVGLSKCRGVSTSYLNTD